MLRFSVPENRMSRFRGFIPLYLQGSPIESRSGNQQYWLRIFVVLLNPSMKMKYSKLK